MKILLENESKFYVYLNNVKFDTEVDGEILDPAEEGLTENQFVEVIPEGAGIVDLEADVLEVAIDILTENAGFCVKGFDVDRIVIVDPETNGSTVITTTI